MLKTNSVYRHLFKSKQIAFSGGIQLPFKRFNSSSDGPKEVFTRINDPKDPKRQNFFQYTWGSWLIDDKIEKAKRQTKFSIEGLTKLIQNLGKETKNAEKDENGATSITPPKKLDDGSVILPHNSKAVSDSDDSLLIKSIASIHEGKHHRIYKVSLSSGKDLVLRIPYKLESDYAISQKIKSECATIDFLDLKLGLKVPKIIAYGPDSQNSVESPFILMEYISGDLLMRKWDPLTPDVEGSSDKLLSVIEPIAAFQEKVLSFTFNKFGSLYFSSDVSALEQDNIPYDGEESEELQNRWKIGPTISRSFAKNKNKLSSKHISQYNKVVDSDKPLEVISSVAEVELENLKNRLALAQADAGGKVENITLLNKMITTFEHLKVIAPKSINPNSKAIPNVGEIFKPRLNLPDLDPLNVIVAKEKNDEFFFLDFEYSSIQPFILTSYPAFVAYQGVKIYNLEEEVPGFNELEEREKEQYRFVYYKTRNERLWELELNKRRHDLIAIASPYIKALKNPYIQALNFKNDKDYLYVEEAIIQLQPYWETFVLNELCNDENKEFPIEYSSEYLDEHQTDLDAYQMELASQPFAATGGWVPQDMFSSLKEQGILVADSNGNYKIQFEEQKDNEKDTN
ncbi:Piso0_004790 [Millerozyma farinosa CBS 7064]|uniref:Altered inheritance of mitochondria protein 9, mitochondrial n=1 Tax=Pichia sorbitophila (strain ATCC MYA-4447 / BCRC 22081 / CBS 7064 / NBRC 10061 / NRRL Y-12695) TaxID=559304 RepID=G8Y3E0_PICSO|nr:Piso0_004790 [Millerozyma farinosa CBS 7064]